MSTFQPEVYTEEQLAMIEDHIEMYFGEIKNVFHELFSPDIHVDISVIAPSPEKNFWTLITTGMGAHKMNVPQGAEQLSRAELVVTLPPEWDLQNSTNEKWYWPIRWLKILARLPIEHDTWLGWGHSVPNGQQFAENTCLSGMLLVDSPLVSEEAQSCVLPNDEEVQFYHLIPLYEDEMNFKISHSTQDLLELLLESSDFSHIIQINRKNTCATLSMTH